MELTSSSSPESQSASIRDEPARIAAAKLGRTERAPQGASRATVVTQMHYQCPMHPHGASHSFEAWLETQEQAYDRFVRVDELPRQVDTGWCARPHVLLLFNMDKEASLRVHGVCTLKPGQHAVLPNPEAFTVSSLGGVCEARVVAV